MRILSPIRNIMLASAFAMSAVLLPATTLAKPLEKDVFELHDAKNNIPPSGTNNELILKNAPSPDVSVMGVNKKAKFVVDLSKNVLYSYNADGEAEQAYLIASGKKSTPTDTGIRVVSHVETYPYRTAPRATKRRKNPRDYGPKIIILNDLNVKTGKQTQIGEFIHGNNKPESIGKYASKGCMRMDNEVIKILAAQVKRGDIVKIIK